MKKIFGFIIMAMLSAASFAEGHSAKEKLSAGKGLSTNERQIRLEYALDITEYTARVRSMTENPLPPYISASEYMEMTLEQAFEQYKKIADEEPENLIAQCAVGYCYYNGRGTEASAEKGKSYLKKAADKNFAPAINTLGAYSDSDEEAFRLYQKAASLNYMTALLNLEDCYEEGKGCERSLEKAEETLLKIRDLYPDNDTVYIYLAVFHRETLNEEKSKYLPYYLQAAERGNRDAMFALWFNIYSEYEDDEDGTNGANRAKWYRRYHEERAKMQREKERIAKEKFPYLLKRAERGELYAIKKLVSYYDDYSQRHTNKSKAYEWRIKAADKGDGDACAYLASTLVEGKFESRNFKKAVFYFDKAVESYPDKKFLLSYYIKDINEAAFGKLKVYGFINRYNKSQDEYASTYLVYYGDDLSFVEEKDALAFCEKYAEKNKDCSLALAYYKYLNESKEAAEKYLDAHGLSDAKEFLDYTNDPYDPNSKENQVKRAMWDRQQKEEMEGLKKRIAENPYDAEAWYLLANIYDNSSTIEAKKKAFDCYTKSADLEYKNAYYPLANFYKWGDICDCDAKKAGELYEKGADAGDANCLNALAEMYRDGTYFDKEKNDFVQDIDKAIELLKKALQLDPESFSAKHELSMYNIKVSDDDDDELYWLYHSKPKKDAKPFDWDSWTFGDFEFEDKDAYIPEYKEDDGYWEDTEIVECSFAKDAENYFAKVIASLKPGKNYRLVFAEDIESDMEKLKRFYDYFSADESPKDLTLDLDLRKCKCRWLGSYSICGKFRNIYLPDKVAFLANDSLVVYAKKIVFGSGIKNFSDPIDSRGIGLMDFTLVSDEDFSARLAYSISQLKVNYMRGIPIKANFEFYTVEDVHSLKIIKELRNTLESNPDKKYVVDFSHSAYARDPLTGENIPFPRNFLAKQNNLYYLILAGCDKVEFPDNFCRDCKNLRSIIMWDFDEIAGDGAFEGVYKDCTITGQIGPEILLRNLF
ncbi:MAG: sel1 repeat family protein [Treponema sp.]|nr:sel1 repeat family protein [Treponema sp.]